LVRPQFAHLEGLIGSRVEIAGPPLRIAAEAALPLAMALHELATNAGKYGALNNSEGKVSIAWDAARGGNFI
jgi:two-component sensor histidine kinase